MADRVSPRCVGGLAHRQDRSATKYGCRSSRHGATLERILRELDTKLTRLLVSTPRKLDPGINREGQSELKSVRTIDY